MFKNLWKFEKEHGAGFMLTFVLGMILGAVIGSLTVDDYYKNLSKHYGWKLPAEKINDN